MLGAFLHPDYINLALTRFNMDHVSVVSPVAVRRLPIDGGGACLSPRELSLVSIEEFVNSQALPAGLGELPFYLEDDGYLSINGPIDLTLLPSRTAVAPVNHGNHPTIHPFITSVNSSGQQTWSKKRSYICSEPGCTWRSSLPTKQGLERHYDGKHLNIRVDCPILGCEKVRDKGVKRKDNLSAHVLKKHGIKLPRRSLSNCRKVPAVGRYRSY
ncbi:hypothetical protein C7212DRAFT_362378 [Tuber magnatum]|uniref:C2H2-type domain-containing protein n=1 Tax=Tuber magnatum TaxID=42249 RepID=A0A317SU71_9PEZI|nr:hypothetical protein C7212DRAFT_362378 [Tuber magnatum]